MVWQCCLSLCPMSIHPPIQICLSVHPPICPSIHPSILSISVHRDVCTWVLYTCHRSYYGMALLSVFLSTHPSVRVCLSVHPTVCPSIFFLCLSVHVCQSICPSVFCLSMSIHMYVHEFYTPVTGGIMVWRCCLSLCPSIHSRVPVCPSACLSVHLLSVSVCAYLCTQVLYTHHRSYYGMALLSVSLSICASVQVCLSVHMSVHLSSVSVRTCMYICRSIHPSVCITIFLSVRQFANMIFVPHSFRRKTGD